MDGKGLGGFRIDAIINIKKKLPFSDYPADRADGLCSVGRMLEEAEGIGEFLGEMAEKCFHPYDAFTVGEVFNERKMRSKILSEKTDIFHPCLILKKPVTERARMAGMHPNRT